MDTSDQLERIRNSRQFHKDWYKRTYLADSTQAIDPAEHYLNQGAAKGHNPGKFFDTTLYVTRYPDVAASGLNPLVHYEVIGAQEKRIVNPVKAQQEDKRAALASEKAKAKERAEFQKLAESAAVKSASESARKIATEAARKVATETATKIVAAELKKLAASPKPSANAQMAAGLVQSTALDELSKKARAAAQKKDWLAASRHWQQALALPAEPYVGLSEAAAEMGDMARAEEILRDGLARFENNPMLLEAYCRLSLRLKSWSEAAHRWEMIESCGCIVDPKLQIAVAEAFLQIGEVMRAAGLLDELRNSHATDINYKRLSGLLAEARQEWDAAAEIWLNRGAKATGVTKINSYLRGVRALISGDDLDRAEDEAQKLVAKFPREIAYLKLYAEVAIAQDAWAVALERWQKVEAVDPAEAGAMPPEWVYQIGVENARKRTEAIRIGRLRGTGMLTLATTIQSVDEAGALLFARRARKYYAEHVREMVARLLSMNTRHSASIWWVRRLLATSAAPQKYYPTLIESLLESSRLEECEAVLAEYLERYSKDNLWLRAMVEIHYRRSDFAAMRDVMQSAIGKKLPISFKSVSVMRWLYSMIRLHPTPQTFLPIDIHDLVLRTAAIYDSKFVAASIGMLLDPAQGDAAAINFRKQLDLAMSGEQPLDPVQQEEMLNFFIRRREWDDVENLLSLEQPCEFDDQNVKKVWNLVRNKLDIQLGNGDVVGAEKTAIAHLENLKRAGQNVAILQQAVGMITRLPVSGRVVGYLEETALELGFVQLAARAKQWRLDYGDRDYSNLVGIAQKKRCFVVGNAPSIAQLPLHLLEGEDIICMNRGMRAMDVGLPLPKCLVVADPLVYKNHGAELDADGASVGSYFIGTNCLWRQPSTVPAVPLGSSGLKLSLAPFKHVPWNMHRGDTVAILAASIAHLMGYQEIYIIGVDLDYSGPVTHFYIKPGGGQKEVERLANFRPGGSGAELVNLSFANLQKVVEGDGCRLYNAAPAGKLDMLERVNFYDVLGLPRPQDDTGHDALHDALIEHDTLIERAAQ